MISFRKTTKTATKRSRICVVYGCGLVADAAKAILIHDNRAEATEEDQEDQDDQVGTIEISQYFKPEDFGKFLRTLRHDSFGKIAYPTIYPLPISRSGVTRRKVLNEASAMGIIRPSINSYRSHYSIQGSRMVKLSSKMSMLNQALVCKIVKPLEL